MRMNRKITVFILFSFLTAAGIYAQSVAPVVIASSGGEGEAGGIHIQWTVGELATETLTGANMILTQGFHQPHIIVTSIDEIPDTEAVIVAFPNPATDYIAVEQRSGAREGLHFGLYDLQGRRVLSGQLEPHHTSLDLIDVKAGTYFLHIYDDSKTLQTFKVVKNR
ncbi:MAG: T9SS C-terminal target domain-containing protein [Bacteroidia bacterium]|nr:MAG: T9SS C-terminal target domain-containing protein [Bacteroidia bacterium]